MTTKTKKKMIFLILWIILIGFLIIATLVGYSFLQIQSEGSGFWSSLYETINKVFSKVWELITNNILLIFLLTVLLLKTCIDEIDRLFDNFSEFDLFGFIKGKTRKTGFPAIEENEKKVTIPQDKKEAVFEPLRYISIDVCKYLYFFDNKNLTIEEILYQSHSILNLEQTNKRERSGFAIGLMKGIITSFDGIWLDFRFTKAKETSKVSISIVLYEQTREIIKRRLFEEENESEKESD